jgi:putative membrane protein
MKESPLKILTSTKLKARKRADVYALLRSTSHLYVRHAMVGMLIAGGLACSTMTFAAGSLSGSDLAFVQKVSQGGMFEVAASKVAVEKAQAQDVKDQANTEVHDHELVGQKLRSIALANGVDLPTQLNADFQKRVDRLSALSGPAFDQAYLQEMGKIHALDGAAFAQEAKTGQNPDLRAFGAETVRIVERHIGALHGTDANYTNKTF